MDIKQIILDTIKKDNKTSVREMMNLTGYTRSYLQRFFKNLCDEGKIVLIGKTNQAHYILALPSVIATATALIKDVKLLLKNEHLQEDQVLKRIQKTTGIFVDLPESVKQMVEYAFTEILNNAIEHSKSNDILVKMGRSEESVFFSIYDYGIGIFQNISQKRKYPSSFEAIQDLLKGKLTTAPEAHSGEGIFFTSKVADRLVIKSSQKQLIFDNVLDDVTVDSCAPFIGTRVTFTLALSTTRNLADIFREFSNDAFEFSKTKVHVRLYQLKESFVSRSQARRILTGLESFETILLDFKEVQSIGQGFADEIFRVWPAHHPDKKILTQNLNENIDFMIQRAISQPSTVLRPQVGP